MKKKGLSMNFILVLCLSAVAVSVLVCGMLVFLQTYREAMTRNAQTTSRQAVAQVSGVMNDYLEDLNDALDLLEQ